MPNVIGVFENSSQAQRAVEQMINVGIDRDEISFVTSDSDQEKIRDHSADRTTGKGGGIGAAVERFFSRITDMGVPDEHVRHYEDRLREGEILVTVHADNDNEADRAYDIMQTHGAVDGEGRTTSDRDKAWTDREHRTLGTEGTEQRDFSNRDRATIPVTEEQMTVGKRAVESGRVRVYGRVTEKPVEESVRLRDERVHVERRAVDRPVTDADRRKDDVVIEITEMKEEPVVGKQERVVEEIVIGKTADEHTETVRDKVRRKDVEVERTDREGEQRTRDRR